MAGTNSTFDVIVLGYGSAGGNAALQASRNGARVLLLDKALKPGGNSFVSSANITMPTDFGFKDKADGRRFAEYLEEVAQGTTPKTVINAYVEGLYELPKWLQDLGAEWEENSFERMWTYYIPALTFPKLPSAENLDLKVYHIKQTDRCPAPTAGRRVWELLDSHLQKAENVEIRTGVRVRRIRRDGEGPVTGVLLDNGEIIATKAVIMACGGFENDVELKRDCLGPRDIGLLGSPVNTGDGIRLAQFVGAKLWHMTAEASVLGFKPPGSSFGFALALREPSFVIVNRHGQRILDETKLESHRGHSDTAILDHESGKYAHDPIWLITDFSNVETDKSLVLEVFSHMVVNEGYQWSPYSRAEVNKGWVRKASSIAQLAAMTNLNASDLDRTLSEFNLRCKSGQDPQGRKRESMAPLGPPYYAMRLQPLLYNTQGGPQRNEKAEILDPEEQPIPGLYGAGECGSVWGHAYQSSCNFGETIVFGRIAGAEAAKYALGQTHQEQVPIRTALRDDQ